MWGDADSVLDERTVNKIRALNMVLETADIALSLVLPGSICTWFVGDKLAKSCDKISSSLFFYNPQPTGCALCFWMNSLESPETRTLFILPLLNALRLSVCHTRKNDHWWLEQSISTTEDVGLELEHFVIDNITNIQNMEIYICISLKNVVITLLKNS